MKNLKKGGISMRMEGIKWLVAMLLLCVFAGLDGVSYGAEAEHPNKGTGEPTIVKMRYVVLDIDGVDSSVQNFTMNLFFSAEWNDPRLKHDGGGPISKPLESVWHPHLQILNRQKIFKTMEPRAVIFPDGSVIVSQRVWGDFSQILDLKNFPFDEQKFEVVLLSAGYPPSEVQLVLDKGNPSGISPKFSLPDWDINDHGGWGHEGSLFEGLPESAMFTVSIEAKRRSTYYLLKVILPLILIVAMSWIVFWVDPEQAGTQIGVATTSMLTLIAYRFSIDNLVPAVSYLTRMDAFILGSTLLVFAILCEAVFTSVLAKHGRSGLAVKIDRWCRVIVPVGFLALVIQVFIG